MSKVRDIPCVKDHPEATTLAYFMSGALPPHERDACALHLSSCDECLKAMVAAHEAVTMSGGTKPETKRKDGSMKRSSIYPLLALAAFLMSFLVPKYFLQLLVATVLLAMKWIVDSKTTKMLIMIHDAWKRGQEKELSHLMSEIKPEKRF